MTVYDNVIILRPDVVKIDPSARVDSFTKIEGGDGVTIGAGVHIASFSHLNIGGGKLIMGDCSAAASGSRIVTGSNKIAGQSCSASAPPEMQVVERSSVTIGRYAVLFVNAVVLPGVTLGEGAAVAAGAVVRSDVPAWEVWGGIPARKIGERPHEPELARQVNSKMPGDWAVEQTRGGCLDMLDDKRNIIMRLPPDLTPKQVLEIAWNMHNKRYGGMNIND